MPDPQARGGLTVLACGAEAADVIHELTQAAFHAYEALDPPSGASRETVESVRSDLEAGGGAVALLDDRPVGCLRFTVEADHMHVRRVAVAPALQGTGVGRALMEWAEREAAGRSLTEVTVGVRLALPANLAVYRRLGYEVVEEHSHDGYRHPTWVSMRKPLSAAC